MCVETIDSTKLAKLMNKECEKICRTMDVMVQVNTGGEDSRFILFNLFFIYIFFS